MACSGTCGTAPAKRFEFEGLHSCQAVKRPRTAATADCKFGCLGYGDCVSVCAFDAIHVVNGVAHGGPGQMHRLRCLCQGLPQRHHQHHPGAQAQACGAVRRIKDKGAQTRKACSAGCIGCMKCAKACPKQAITVENNLAYIDQEKCVGCGLCAKECPVGVIHVPAAYAQQVMSPAQEEAPAANA